AIPSTVCRDSVATIPYFSFVRWAGIYVRQNSLSSPLRRSFGGPSTKSLQPSNSQSFTILTPHPTTTHYQSATYAHPTHSA
ncbi:MAG: hypothetical protein ACSW8I_05820, partial [bacterium]